ncbi:hypothetical protein D5b_00286 [Faustovirus]|nr:hypothetical protein D5b_00286 [Faustovirus]AMN84626.1 hypothetical protein D6_00223 [Faustovirus]
MSFLHEIINTIDEYVLILGSENKITNGKLTTINLLYIYNISQKNAIVYTIPRDHGGWGEFHGPNGEHPDLYPGFDFTRYKVGDALWLLRQEMHDKTPLKHLLTLCIRVEDLKKEILFENNQVLSNHSAILSKFKAIYIHANNISMLIKWLPSNPSSPCYINMLTFNDKIQSHLNYIYIDILTPHNIAKKMRKIWRKITSPEHDLVDVMNM